MKATALILAGTALVAVPAVSAPVLAATAHFASTPADTAETAHFLVVDGDTLVLADPLEVIGSRVPAALPGATRQVGLLAAEDLLALPGRGAAELLQSVPGVVTGCRSPAGMQSDLSIRGSTFEQVQVLLDGYDLGDPQTGHHLLDLPLHRSDIRRLEVLPGHGSALYGSGAFGGTVNVVPERPTERNGGEAALTGGGLGTGEARAMLEFGCPCRETASRFSAAHFASDGPTGAGTDSKASTATGRLVTTAGGGQTDLFAGWAEREFGAPGFYAPYPSWERTGTFFAAARHNRSLGDRLTVEPRIHFRRHEDRFVLLRNDPDVYTNDHTTRKVGGDLRGIVDLGGRHAIALGLEGVTEDIASRGLRGGAWGDALGNHDRRRFSAAIELDRNREPLRWQLGGRVDTRDEYAPRFSGTAAVSLDLGGALAVRGSAGTVYRVPTFTELYYVAPTDVGDPGLEPEEGWSWDAGLRWNRGRWHAEASFFERREENLIEWARASGASVWRAMNIAEGTVRGTETTLAWRHGGGPVLQVGWAWLEKETSLPSGYEGKYGLLTPRHALTGRGTAILPANLAATVTGRYIERTGGPDDFRVSFLLDAGLDWNGPDGWFVELTGSNLLDRSVQEVPGVMLPGAWVTGTLGRRF